MAGAKALRSTIDVAAFARALSTALDRYNDPQRHSTLARAPFDQFHSESLAPSSLNSSGARLGADSTPNGGQSTWQAPNARSSRSASSPERP
jgi:hypothetical protein